MPHLSQVVKIGLSAFAMFGTQMCLASLSAFAPSNRDLSNYQSVNLGPRFISNEKAFGFYWALWRTLSPLERAETLKFSGANLISKRHIHFETRDCQTQSLYLKDQETYWYRDRIALDGQNRLRPNNHANRPDYLYIVLGNLMGMHLKNLEPFAAPRRNRGESSSEYQARLKDLSSDWQSLKSLQNSYGTVTLHSVIRLYSNALPVSDIDFLPPSAAREILQHRADRWPVYFDERAHKEFSAFEPKIWNYESGAPLSDDTFLATLKWSACDIHQPVSAYLELGWGILPEPGPNRTGQGENGAALIEIKTKGD